MRPARKSTPGIALLSASSRRATTCGWSNRRSSASYATSRWLRNIGGSATRAAGTRLTENSNAWSAVPSLLSRRSGAHRISDWSGVRRSVRSPASAGYGPRSMRARPTARERTYSGDQGWEHQYRTATGTSLSPDSHFRRILESLITTSRANVLTLPPTFCHSPIRALIMLRACSFDSH